MPPQQLMLLPIETPPRLPALPPQNASLVANCLADLLLQIVSAEAERPALREVDNEIVR